MDTTVGPIAVEVVEPLKTPARDASATTRTASRPTSLSRARASAVEEPRFTYPHRPAHDDGLHAADAERHAMKASSRSTASASTSNREMCVGTRDRSWGVRPIGLGDPQPVAPPRAAAILLAVGAAEFRRPLHALSQQRRCRAARRGTRRRVIGALGDAEPVHMASCASTIDYKSGTRHAQSAVIETVRCRRRHVARRADAALQFLHVRHRLHASRMGPWPL